MKILLDEMMPRRLARAFAQNEVHHVRDLGWKRLTNGTLLREAKSNGFEVFITLDFNLQFQQNLALYELVVIVLRIRVQSFDAFSELAPRIEQALVDSQEPRVIVLDTKEP